MQHTSRASSYSAQLQASRLHSFGSHLLSVLACLAILAAGRLTPAAVAHAEETNQFGPPWVGIIVSDDAVTHTEPSLDSPPIGPLGQDAKLAVLSQVQGGPGPDGDSTWYITPVGILPSAVITEYRQPWIAEAVKNGVALYAKASAKSPIRRLANSGDLLRVTGMSPGLDGDADVWWSTTEGYAHLDTIRPADGQWAQSWTMPAAAEAQNGWWGEIVSEANVRAGATTDAPIVGGLHGGQRVKVLAQEQGQNVSGSATWYLIDGGRFAGARVHSSLIRKIAQPTPNLTPPSQMPADLTWVNVDRKSSTLTVVKDGNAVFVTYVSLGKTGRDSPAGLFSTFGKYVYDDMTSTTVPNADHSYDLPNVPYTQYYKLGGYALHGTYWHDEFGTQQSQGCINVTVTDGAYLFGLTSPSVAAGASSAWSGESTATPLQILD